MIPRFAHPSTTFPFSLQALSLVTAKVQHLSLHLPPTSPQNSIPGEADVFMDFNIVYCIQCSQCGLLYIGEIRPPLCQKSTLCPPGLNGAPGCKSFQFHSVLPVLGLLRYQSETTHTHTQTGRRASHILLRYSTTQWPKHYIPQFQIKHRFSSTPSSSHPPPAPHIHISFLPPPAPATQFFLPPSTHPSFQQVPHFIISLLPQFFQQSLPWFCISLLTFLIRFHI